MNFESLNNYFDKIFVITLQRSTDRQSHISKALEGLHYEYFFGADKNDFSIAELTDKNIYNEALAIKHHRYSKKLNLGQICCSLSHKKVYEEIISKGYKNTLILEDDVEPVKNISNIFPQIINELPGDWELLYFDYLKNEKPQHINRYWYHIRKIAGKIKWDHDMIKNIYAKKISKHISVAGFHDYTDAYAITNEAAKKLLQLQTPVSYIADNLLAIASATKKINAFASHPKLFHQLSQGETSTFDSLL